MMFTTEENNKNRVEAINLKYQTPTGDNVTSCNLLRSGFAYEVHYSADEGKSKN